MAKILGKSRIFFGSGDNVVEVDCEKVELVEEDETNHELTISIGGHRFVVTGRIKPNPLTHVKDRRGRWISTWPARFDQ